MSKKTAKKVTTKKCVVCKKKFTPKVANATVCSDECRKALKAKRDKARTAEKHATKTECKCKEKIVLPKKPVAKKETKTVIDVKGNPHKVIILSLITLLTALEAVMKSGEVKTTVRK